MFGWGRKSKLTSLQTEEEKQAEIEAASVTAYGSPRTTEDGVPIVRHVDRVRPVDAALNTMESAINDRINRIDMGLAALNRDADGDSTALTVPSTLREEVRQLPAQIESVMDSVRAKVVGDRIKSKAATQKLAAVVSNAPPPLDEDGVALACMNPEYAAQWFLRYARWHAEAQQASAIAQTQADGGLKTDY